MSHAESMAPGMFNERLDLSRQRTPVQDVRSIIAKAELKIEAALAELSQALTPQDITVELEKPALSPFVTKVNVRVTL